MLWLLCIFHPSETMRLIRLSHVLQISLEVVDRPSQLALVRPGCVQLFRWGLSFNSMQVKKPKAGSGSSQEPHYTLHCPAPAWTNRDQSTSYSRAFAVWRGLENWLEHSTRRFVLEGLQEGLQALPVVSFPETVTLRSDRSSKGSCVL